MVRFYYLLFLSGILLAFPDIQAKTKSADTSLLNWDVAPETKMVIMSIETGNRAQLFYANDGDTVAYLISRDTNFNIYQPRFVFDSVIIAIKASTEIHPAKNGIVLANILKTYKL